MSRISFSVQFARIIQKLPLSVFRIIEIPIVHLLKDQRNKPNIIILLALPRSGSTLAYQILSHSIKSTYLTNFGNLLYQLPLLGGWLSKIKCSKFGSDFKSQQGFVQGLCGQAEGLRYWSYWFANGIDERKPFLINQKKLLWRKKYLKNTFTILSSPEFPIITGYLGHVLKWEQIRSQFPDALFVRLHRDPISNALSLLKSRDDQNTWYSVFPKECQEYLSSSPHEQVASQVYWLNKRLESIKNIRVIHLDYEQLCEEPSATLNRVIQYCNKYDFKIRKKWELPEKFTRKTINHDDNRDAILITKAFIKLEKKHGVLNKNSILQRQNK